MGTTAVTPNANGSITGIAYSTPLGFTYNNAGKLATATSGGGTVLSYLYDGFGQRIGKTDTIQRFEAYDWLGRYIEQTDNTDTAKLDYIYLEGMPVATFVPNASTGTLSFLHTDRLGTPRLATSSAKAIGWNATTSDPFNSPNNIVGNSIANDLRMPGQEFESSTGFNHNGWREYAPALGRYLESDPIGLSGGVNTYAYALGNPSSYFDTLGLAATAACPNPKDKCTTLREAILEKSVEIFYRINEYDQDYFKLPLTGRQSRAGHVQQIGEKKRNLNDLLKAYYDAGCGGPPPMGQAALFQPVPAITPSKSMIIPPWDEPWLFGAAAAIQYFEYGALILAF